ncbi:fungal-specific transcription factor domain-containing protein [Powellomyces hirtus]|nr:fungal-specific transcription factor domain-containing protein [Powellomyces hirtus]
MAEETPPLQDWAFPGFNLDLSALLGVDDNQLHSFQDLLFDPVPSQPQPQPQPLQQLQQEEPLPLPLQQSPPFQQQPELPQHQQQQQQPQTFYQTHFDRTAYSNAFPTTTDSPEAFDEYQFDSLAPSSSIHSGRTSSTHSLSGPAFGTSADTHSPPAAYPMDNDGSYEATSTSGPAKRRKQQPSTRASAKSNTRRKACEPCRSKKLRCDGIRPHCTTCVRSTQGASQCLYYADNPNAAEAAVTGSGSRSFAAAADGGKEKKRRGTADVKALEDRVNALEAMLASAMADRSPSSPDDSTPSPEQHVKPTAPANTTWPTDGFFDAVGKDVYTTSIPSNQSSDPPTSRQPPVAAHILTASNTDPTQHHPHVSCPNEPSLPTVAAVVNKTWFCDFISTFQQTLQIKALETHVSKKQMVGNAVLPDLNDVFVRHDLVEQFFNRRSANAPFDFLHRDSFIQDIEIESPMLLFALYAIVSKTSDNVAVRNSGSFFYQRARKLVPMHIENPTMSGLQGLAFLCAASMGQGLMSAGWMYLGMACRMALFLKLDVDPDELGNFTWAEAEVRRRVWWCLTNLDRIKSAVQAKSAFLPPVIPPRVKYPCPDAVWEAADVHGNLPAHMVGVSYPAFTAENMKFTDLYGRAIEYNQHALKAGVDLEAFCPTVTVLESEIHRWYRNLPPMVHMVETSQTFTSSLHSNDEAPYHAVTSYMMYKCALCLLRRPRIIAALTCPTRTLAAAQAIEDATAVADDIAAIADLLICPVGTKVHADFISFAAGLGTLEASFIQIMASALARSEHQKDKFEEHQHKFQTLVKLLRALGKRSPPSRLMGDIVTVINQELMARGPTRTCRKPSSTTTTTTTNTSTCTSSDPSTSAAPLEEALDDHRDDPPNVKDKNDAVGSNDDGDDDDDGAHSDDTDHLIHGLNHDRWVREMVIGVCAAPMGALIQDAALPAGHGGCPASLGVPNRE